MRLVEHEAKQVLRDSGINIPNSMLCKNSQELTDSLIEIGMPAVIKAQIPVGGRGKKGIIKIVQDLEEAGEAFDDMIGRKVDGFEITEVLIEEMIDTTGEIFLSITVDPNVGGPVLLISNFGGMEIENVPKEKMGTIALDIEGPLPRSPVSELLRDQGIEEQLRDRAMDIISSMWKIFLEKECELVEINPLFATRTAELVAGDAKIILNDDALFRHPELRYDADRWKGTFEKRCKDKGLVGVELSGDVGVIANGAGLTMAVLDSLTDFNMKGGAFLDLGGTDDPGRIRDAIELMNDHTALPGLRGMIICVFGGITKCDTVAEGIVKAMGEIKLAHPMVIRLRGVNEDLARDILDSNGIECYKSVRESCAALARRLG